MADMANNTFEQHKLERELTWIEMWEDLEKQGIRPVELWEGGAPGYIPTERQAPPRIAVFPAIPSSGAEPPPGLIIICAGGGFNFKSRQEGKPVAEYFQKRGINAAILDYRCVPHTPMDACADGLRAVRWVRYHAEELNINPNKVALSGFSAGGILTALAATHFDYGNPEAEDPIERISSRPDAALLFYGAMARAAVMRSGLSYDIEAQREAAKYDPLKCMRSDAPPFFIFQTHADDPRFAMNFGKELADRGIPFEVHTFHGGRHGQGLYDGSYGMENVPHTAHWAELAVEWLEDQGF